tara:strand:+ start:1495 stop:1743 length:249 start_codon:yes stop_codon:yes gene_type:complete
MQNYNMLIYFQVASLFGGGDKYASPYMAIRKPLLVTILKSCNPKRFKPTNYKRGKVINHNYKYASIKGKPLKCVGCSISRVF